ncbi:hypothetical protein FB567DRAFT_561017 [Paraphoma chrysanthemicola]|uniref:Uncharacterized protein n=1 Tax=Paraphoma chrysanthemicola TaxID=798071 RepID=A0A8K0VYD1_9PLEO|nr:hypothetical protein FB567DRAFT_561017 [Paraphoma chrysanthemicola]
MPPKKLNRTTSQQEIPHDELEKIAQNTDSPQSKLQEAAAAAESALAAQKTASSLRAAAEAIKDPKKREQYLTDAYNKEIEAHGNSKKARILTSGAFQGGIGGAGIGAAVSTGLGTVVGTIVGGVTAIPATAVGGLAGMATGAVHGPWIKLNKIGKEGRVGDGKEKVEKGPEIEGGDGDMDVEGDDGVVPNPEVLREAARKMGEKEGGETKAGGKAGGGGEKKQAERKKPRKLEVRSKQAQAA